MNTTIEKDFSLVSGVFRGELSFICKFRSSGDGLYYIGGGRMDVGNLMLVWILQFSANQTYKQGISHLHWNHGEKALLGQVLNRPIPANLLMLPLDNQE
jgi:hypothetical protein